MVLVLSGLVNSSLLPVSSLGIYGSTDLSSYGIGIILLVIRNPDDLAMFSEVKIMLITVSFLDSSPNMEDSQTPPP